MVIVDREVEALGKPTGGGSSATQVIPAGIQRIGAVGFAYTGAGVGVAVVDTGIDLSNVNLAAPYSSPTASYTFDGDLEGILNVGGALSAP